MCVETLRTCAHFSRTIDLGVTCLGLVGKWTFSYLSPWKHHKYVLKPSEPCLFFHDNRFEGLHAYVYSKNEHFPIHLLGNTINVCWNPQNSARFSKMINLRGHMPRFTLENEHFPIYLLGNTINVCWNPQNRAHFSRTIDLGVTCLGLVGKWTFSYLSPWKHHKCVLKPSEPVLVFPWQSIWGVTCLGLL